MRHRNKIKKLDREKAPREMMLRNLAASVLIYESVSTTEAKAKAVRSLVEKTITIAKKDDLIGRRRLIALLPQPNAVKKLMEVIGKRYKGRKGGYTRIIKLNNRQGDGAKMVRIELV